MILPTYTLIDTAGQLTAVINESKTFIDQAIIGQKLLSLYPTMGQVAFVNPAIRMMGGELSINGTIAANYFLKKFTKPTFMSVSFEKSIVKQVFENQVMLSGIKYKLVNTQPSKSSARQYCGNDPACGYIVEKSPGKIIPIVYVRGTDTLITETACGSASLAYFLLFGQSQVIQPSGQTIAIEEINNRYQVSLMTTKIKNVLTDKSSQK